MSALNGASAGVISNGVKRILIFSIAYVPFVGGAELAIKEITGRLDPKEYSFDLITLRFDRALPAIERIGNVTVHRIGFSAHAPKVSDRSLPLPLRIAKLLYPFTAYAYAVNLHRKDPFDMVWAMMANQAGFAALFFKRRFPNVSYLLELQDGTPLERMRSRRPLLTLLWPLYRRVYLDADAIKAISRFIEKLARKIGYRKTIEIIPNGVDIAAFSSPISDEERRSVRAQWGLGEDDTVLFTASRLVLSRGVEDIIRALVDLPASVKLVIAGDGEDREELARITRDGGVEDRCVFMGQVEHAVLPKYFKASDIFVRPSIIEGMGSAFIEAFAAGVPVVATAVGGIPDFLVDARADNERGTGLFCAVRDPRSLAEAVRCYMDDPALVSRVVENARAAANGYDWNLIALRQKELFARLITPRFSD